MSFSRIIFLREEIAQQQLLPYQQIIVAKYYHQTKSTNTRGFKKIY